MARKVGHISPWPLEGGAAAPLDPRQIGPAQVLRVIHRRYQCASIEWFLSSRSCGSTRTGISPGAGSREQSNRSTRQPKPGCTSWTGARYGVLASRRLYEPQLQAQCDVQQGRTHGRAPGALPSRSGHQDPGGSGDERGQRGNDRWRDPERGWSSWQSRAPLAPMRPPTTGQRSLPQSFGLESGRDRSTNRRSFDALENGLPGEG